MAKQRKKSDRAEASGDASPPGGPPPRWLRLLLGLLAAWHVFAVFVSPLSVPPTSRLVLDVAQSKWVRWYTEPLYLNHGYHFFGPEPPINHVVRWTITGQGGETIAEGEFPDKAAQRPRLYYHRHMMLADQAGIGPAGVEPDTWTNLSLRAYGRRLLRRHGGDRVRVEYVRHALLFPGQAARGDDPNDPGMFSRVATVEETASGLDTPLGVPPAPRRLSGQGGEELPSETIPFEASP